MICYSMFLCYIIMKHFVDFRITELCKINWDEGVSVVALKKKKCDDFFLILL